MLSKLNFPQYKFRIKEEKQKLLIFDVVRKKFVDLAPEEWVRQHIINFCLTELGVPLSLIGVEKQIKINNTIKRFDVLCFNSNLKPILLIECKSPDIQLNQSVAEQSLRYNMVLEAQHIWISNGIQNYILSNQKVTSSLEEFKLLFKQP